MVSKFLQAAVYSFSTALQCLQLLKSCARHGNGLGPELSCWGLAAGLCGQAAGLCGQAGQAGWQQQPCHGLAGRCPGRAARGWQHRPSVISSFDCCTLMKVF